MKGEREGGREGERERPLTQSDQDPTDPTRDLDLVLSRVFNHRSGQARCRCEA